MAVIEYDPRRSMKTAALSRTMVVAPSMRMATQSNRHATGRVYDALLRGSVSYRTLIALEPKTNVCAFGAIWESPYSS